MAFTEEEIMYLQTQYDLIADKDAESLRRYSSGLHYAVIRPEIKSVLHKIVDERWKALDRCAAIVALSDISDFAQG